MLPIHYAPRRNKNYLLLAVFLMHRVQAKTFFPLGRRAHWRLGCFLEFLVGLYLLLDFIILPTTEPPFSQIWQILVISNNISFLE